MYDYETQFEASLARAQAEYDNQTPDAYDDDTVEMTEEEWADLDQNEPDWDETDDYSDEW